MLAMGTPERRSGMPARRLVDRFEMGLADCRDSSALSQLLAHVTCEMGFERFALLHHASLDRLGDHLIRLDNYPADWKAELAALGFAGIDPVHQACSRTALGFAWDRLETLTLVTSRQRDMLARARRFGIANGFTVPVNIPGEAAGSCTFAVSGAVELPRDRLHCAEQIGARAFHAARRLVGAATARRGVRLSRRERQCVGLLAQGHIDREIARQLGISPETVHQYIKRARGEYGAATRAQLAALAWRDGLVPFEDDIPPDGGMD